MTGLVVPRGNNAGKATTAALETAQVDLTLNTKILRLIRQKINIK